MTLENELELYRSQTKGFECFKSNKIESERISRLTLIWELSDIFV